MKRYFLRIIHNLCIHGHFAYLFAIVLKNASFSASFPREKGERKREKIVKSGGEMIGLHNIYPCIQHSPA